MPRVESHIFTPAKVIEFAVLCGLTLPLAARDLVSAEGYAASRDTSFAFTRKPKVGYAAGKVAVRFEAKGSTDVTIAIEDAGGRIVRHLASGLLGPNAPAPLQKNALKQCVIWDGNDDFGEFVGDKKGLKARVSLGLKAVFEKSLHAHPHKFLGTDTRVRAGKEGVYLFQADRHKVNHYLRQYDHDGNYIRTIYPFPPTKLEAVKGLNWFQAPPDGKRLPLKAGRNHGSLLPFRSDYTHSQRALGDIVVGDGLLGLVGRPRLARLAPDGTTGDHEIEGPPTALKGRHGPHFARRAALSPDAKWIYLTRAVGWHAWGRKMGLSIRYGMDHGVYRLATSGDRPPELFLGDPNGGAGPRGFRWPASIDVDSKGRIYVVDWEYGRIQVFSPDGTFHKSLPVKAPVDVVIDRKTDEIFVFSWQFKTIDQHGKDKARIKEYNNRGRIPMLMKFSPIENPRRLLEVRLPGTPTQGIVCTWNTPPTVWLLWGENGKGKPNISVYDLKDGGLVEKRNFAKEVAAAGVRASAPCYQRQFLYFDPRREVLYVGETDTANDMYFSGLWHIDIKSGKQGLRELPFPCADAGFDARGYLYLMRANLVARYDVDTWKEVPFVYGEETIGFVSVLKNSGGHTADFRHYSLGVSPRGDVIVSGTAGNKTGSRSYNDVGPRRWKPKAFPGRPGARVHAHVFDHRGKHSCEDALPGVGPLTGGLGLDWQGNIYAAIPRPRHVGGKPYPQGVNAGTLVRFPSGRARFTTKKNPLVALVKEPGRVAEVTGCWIDGADWLYGGISTGSLDGQARKHGRFCLDYFNRLFVPEFWRYTIAALDANGNVIARFGQYGNADSEGPDSKVPLGGDEIGLFDPHFLATHTDRRLFISDVGNGRIVSAKLGYHATAEVALKRMPKVGR